MKWMNVKDELPKKQGSYLLFGKATCGTHSEIPRVTEGKWYSPYENGNPDFEFGEYSCSIDVSHWMEMPDPPPFKL